MRRPTFYSIGAEQNPYAATAVDLVTFMATGEGAAVNVAWQTAAEIDNKGFHLYRADSYEGPFERLTDKLIPGAGFMTQTRAYNFMDADVTRGRAVLLPAGGHRHPRPKDAARPGLRGLGRRRHPR